MEHGFSLLEWLFPSVINSKSGHVFSALIVAILLILASFLYRKSLKKSADEVIPEGRVSLKNIFQVVVEGVFNFMESVIGHNAHKYVPLIGTVFIYVLVNSLLGAIPGFSPATANVSTNLAVSLTVFVYYNYLGIKEQGLKNYLHHFMGPIIYIAPLMLLIELISHFVRPLTLAVRLFGNLTGDHIVLGIFSDLVPLVVPVLFMAFGIFVSLVQAFVFSLLSTV